MPTFSDNLDGSVGDLLRNRSGWSRPVGADEAQIITGFTGGFAITIGTTVASSTWHVPTSQPSSADQYVTGLLDTVGNATAFPLGIRCDVSNNLGSAYLCRHGTTGQLQLFRRTATGSQASIGTATVTAADLATNPVTLKAVGNQISVEFMGATVIGPLTDTTATSGSVAALSRGGSLSARSLLNSWESGDVAVPGGPTTITVATAAIDLAGQIVPIANGTAITAAQMVYSAAPLSVAIASYILVITAILSITGQILFANAKIGGAAIIQYAGRFLTIPGLVVLITRAQGLSLRLGLGL